MNERENEYRGCRLHRYLVAEATPTERQALREAIQRVNTEGATQIVLLSCYEVDTISRLDAARLRRAAEKRRARRIRQLIQTVCCWLSAACLFIAWGVAGSVECGTRPMCWATKGTRPSPVEAGTAPSGARHLQPQTKGALTQ